ncbi:MAG: hypothetical protein IT384_22620 [Deltaproteobacteria bacterium]|nr:hypothetical protein [Deltaproteobacteria bacterium]
MVVPAVWALAVIAAVGVELAETKGLEPAETRALSAALDRAVSAATGADPDRGAGVRVRVQARRIGWRIRLTAERIERGTSLRRQEIDLTRDRGSWGGPLDDLIRTLLPEGRALGTAAPAQVEATRAPAPGPGAPAPAPRAPAPAPAPVAKVPAAPRAAEMSPPPRAAPPRAADMSPPPPAAPPRAADMSPPPSDSRPSLIAPEATPSYARPLPWVVMGVSAVVLAIGVTQAVSAANAIGDLPTDRLLRPDELEAQQDAVFRGAMLGSVLMSFGASGLVTTMLIVLD